MLTTDTGTHSHISRCTHACQLAHTLARAHAERHTYTQQQQQQHKQNASALEELLLSEVDRRGPVREEIVSVSNQISLNVLLKFTPTDTYKEKKDDGAARICIN